MRWFNLSLLQRDRFAALTHMAHELYQENYHGQERINKRLARKHHSF